MKTIGYVSSANPFIDRKAWSGLVYKIRESIESAGYKVKWIKISPPAYLMLITKILTKLFYGSSTNHPWIFSLMAKYTDWNEANQCDILFFSGGAQIMNHTSCKVPYIYYADACFIQMVNYYWYNLTPRHIKITDNEERKAIQNAFINLRSSEWARDCMINYYNGNEESSFVLEFGANIDSKDIIMAENFDGSSLNVLFSGVDWNRKGGEIAIDTIKILRQKYNVDANISIAGINELPKEVASLPYVKNLGFLNKNNPEEYIKYISAIKQSHLLLLPTKAECAGIVFSEASGYGLPVFTLDTGGIGNYVYNGVNGYRLPLGSSGADFAEKIYNSIKSNEILTLSLGAKKLYDETLNWNIWSKKFKEILTSFLPEK